MLQVYHIAVADSLAGDVDSGEDPAESSVAFAYLAVVLATARSVVLTSFHIPLETMKIKKCEKTEDKKPLTLSEAKKRVVEGVCAFERDHEAQCWGCK